MSKAKKIEGDVMATLGAPTGGPASVATPPPPDSAKRAAQKRLKMASDVADVPIDLIVADPNQPRKEFSEADIEERAESLKAHGQQSPIKVRWDEEIQKYVLIYGELRLRGATKAGLPTLKAIIDNRPFDAKVIRLEQLIENIHRVDLNPVDQARAMQDLIDLYGWTQGQLADELRLERSKVVKALAVINKLPAQVVEMVETQAMPISTAYELTKLPDEETKVEVASTVIREDLSHAETVEEVAKVQNRESKAAKGRGEAPAKVKKRAARPKPETTDDRVWNRSGIKVYATSTSGKGFTRKALLAALRHALESVEAEGEDEPA